MYFIYIYKVLCVYVCMYVRSKFHIPTYTVNYRFTDKFCTQCYIRTSQHFQHTSTRQIFEVQYDRQI